MMKYLEVANGPDNYVKGDLLQFNGKYWEAVRFKDVMRDFNIKIEALVTDIKLLESRLYRVEKELAFNRGEIAEEDFRK